VQICDALISMFLGLWAGARACTRWTPLATHGWQWQPLSNARS